MIKSDSVTKFMDGDAVKIKDRRRKVAAIRIPRNRIIEDGVGLFEITVAIAEHSHRQCSAAKIAAENFVIQCDRHFIVAFRWSHGGVLHPGKVEMRKMLVPGLERVNGGVVR